jgi:hypothetical protein
MLIRTCLLGQKLIPGRKPLSSRDGSRMFLRPRCLDQFSQRGPHVELIRGSWDGNPELMVWDGAKEIVVPLVERQGRLGREAPREHLGLATCSITELGFVRILAQAPQYGFTVAHARTLLLRLKAESTLKFTFIPDDHDVSQFPRWVKNPKTNHRWSSRTARKGERFNSRDAGWKTPKAFLIPANK